MLTAIIVILVVLWLLGYVPIAGINIPDVTLFMINGRGISLWDILILLFISWAIGLLPRPFQLIASVLLLLWVLSVLGIFAVAGLSNILVVAIILGLIISIFF
ncbi:MAG: hypothetical protein U0525_04535 [Patescibacteria group bacterium]